jgi:hypothetical protein
MALPAGPPTTDHDPMEHLAESSEISASAQSRSAQIAPCSQPAVPGETPLSPNLDFLAMQGSGHTHTATLTSELGQSKEQDFWPDCICGDAGCVLNLCDYNPGKATNDTSNTVPTDLAHLPSNMGSPSCS